MRTTPIQLDRLLEPIASCLTPEVAAKLAHAQLDEAAQDRIDYLADRCTEGLLTDAERKEYARYLDVIAVITVLQAKALAILRRE